MSLDTTNNSFPDDFVNITHADCNQEVHNNHRQISGGGGGAPADASSDTSTMINISNENSTAPLPPPPAVALRLEVTPRNEVIGTTNSSITSTEFCTTVTARELPDHETSEQVADGAGGIGVGNSSRAPVDIVVALDISGSMSGRKLDLCKDTLGLLLRELGSQDRFGLVTFGDEARLEIPTRKLTKESKEAALSRIKSLAPDGCTNMSGGIGLAAQELQAVESPHPVRTIFLLTDGHANCGIADRQGIVNLTKGCLGSNGGGQERPEVAIHCFGYGTDHDREMLGDIAKATEGGTYYFVDKDSDVSSAFGDALGGVLSVVAQNVALRVMVPEESATCGVSILSVKHDKAVQQDDGSYLIPLGDFYAEESRDVIVETTLYDNQQQHHQQQKQEKEQRQLQLDKIDNMLPHIVANLTFMDTIQRKLVMRNPEATGFISRPAGDVVSKTNTHVALQCIRIKTTQVLNESESFARNGDLAKARSKITDFLQEVQQEAKNLELTSAPLILQILSELNTALSGLSSHAEYQTFGSKYMQTRCAQHLEQRCAEASEEAFNTYRSSKKKNMSLKMKEMSQK